MSIIGVRDIRTRVSWCKCFMKEISEKADLLAKALQFLRKTRIISVDELSQHLGIDTSTAETLLSVLLAEGYIREISGTNICSQCTLRAVCNIGSGCKYLREGVKVYTLTRRSIK